MTDYGTIKIPREEFERHNKRRQRMALSWTEYIDGQAPEFRDELAEAVVERMDDAKLARRVADELEARLG